MSDAFDPTKPVKTRCGFPARISAMDGSPKKPILAEVKWGEHWHQFDYTINGLRYSGRKSPMDLVNAEEEDLYSEFKDTEKL